jgi:4-hydroxybenzoate polyprenyltransferase
MRPWQWAKNLFVLMPVPFAVAAGATVDSTRFLLGLAGFCLANSAVYVFNDLRDAEQDRLHPTKKLRPIAAGKVSPPVALGTALLLLAGALALTYFSGVPAAVQILGIYVALNVAYSLGAKDVPLLDVFVLASGFVLRVLLGCALISVQPSNWLLLCSSALALFLALCKRRGDLVQGLGEDHRPSLRGYSLQYLDQAMGVTAAMAVTAYGLYTLDAEVLRPGREFASLLFVAYGVLEYLRLAQVEGRGASPMQTVFGSPTLVFAAVGWAVAVAWSVGVF